MQKGKEINQKEKWAKYMSSQIHEKKDLTGFSRLLAQTLKLTKKLYLLR